MRGSIFKPIPVVVPGRAPGGSDAALLLSWGGLTDAALEAAIWRRPASQRGPLRRVQALREAARA